MVSGTRATSRGSQWIRFRLPQQAPDILQKFLGIETHAQILNPQRPAGIDH